MEKDSKGGALDTLETCLINGVWELPCGVYGCHASSDGTSFSSSLPVLSHEKLNVTDSDSCHSLDYCLPGFNKLDMGNIEKDLQEDDEPNSTGILLPGDEEELLACIMDELDFVALPNESEYMEDYDLFGSGGGMELDVEPPQGLSVSMPKMVISNGGAASGFGHHKFPNISGRVSVEHPLGEHPSRTLFVRNINSSVQDSELIGLFEPYGDIRSVYTACKNRGFVMVSYYDIRAALAAMRALQNMPLRKRKLDIHFSIPKDNPSEKDMNQGTLVIFNLDASVSNDDLLKIFGDYGEIKEIRETPQKRHHKFIEYYDVRHAEAAMKALNRSEIAGKRIKLEPSRSGGARRVLIPLPNHELERNEAQIFLAEAGLRVGKSPSGNWPNFGSPVEAKPSHAFSKSPGSGILSPVNSSRLPGLASILPSQMSSSPNVPQSGKGLGRPSHSGQIFMNHTLMHRNAYPQFRPYPEHGLDAVFRPMSPFVESDLSGIKTLSDHQCLWGSPPLYPDYASSVGSTSSAGHPIASGGRVFQYGQGRGSSLGPYQHHVGSAPSGMHRSGHLGHYPSPQISSISTVEFGVAGSNRSYMNTCAHVPSFGMMTKPSSLFTEYGSYQGLGPVNNEGFIEGGRGQHLETSGSQIINNKQCHIDLDRITSGEDTRTTLMIKNIPNKYTYNMLLAEIDENHKETYDFLHMPIDFKNKCNVGYAFINMVSPVHIIPFYQAFNGKRWEKFNSGRVASLAYANIQNSSLMNEDKHCEPILFQLEDQEASDLPPDGSICLGLSEERRGES